MAEQFGFELLAEQIGKHVAARVHRLTTIDYRRNLGEVIGSTPIEKLFAYALEFHARYDGGEPVPLVFVFGRDALRDMLMDERNYGFILVDQQVDLGGWIVDFVVHQYDHAFKLWRQLVIECDGHDFHERTKPQSARDRSRDRAAVIANIPVLRFTGSELWRDPLGCADQVMQWFAGRRS